MKKLNLSKPALVTLAGNVQHRLEKAWSFFLDGQGKFVVVNEDSGVSFVTPTSVVVELIARSVKESIGELVKPDSSSISTLVYHRAQELMLVQFTNNTWFGYVGVTPGTWEKLKEAESTGSFFAKNVRHDKSLTVRQLGDPTLVLNENHLQITDVAKALVKFIKQPVEAAGEQAPETTE